MVGRASSPLPGALATPPRCPRLPVLVHAPGRWRVAYRAYEYKQSVILRTRVGMLAVVGVLLHLLAHTGLMNKSIAASQTMTPVRRILSRHAPIGRRYIFILLILRGTRINRIHDTVRTKTYICISLFLPTICCPIYYGPPYVLL